MFKKIDSKMNLPQMEEEILKFWEENKIFEKSIENRDEKNLYSFYDGPPFATGTPHYGHIVASTMKDVVPRFWTMKGFQVERKWGWDCHGLPIENIVEKEMGSKAKKDIEKLGVEKFNALCRSKVLKYAKEWEIVIRRMGRWADMKNSYKTMELSFMESVWWVFKELWDKGLIYEGYRSMHICPRCETTLSQSEVAEGYKDVKDLSATVKFELVDEPGTYVLAWTTTPWTLIGNVALAVGAKNDYFVLEVEANDVEGLLLKKGDRIIMSDGLDTQIRIFGSPLGYGPSPHNDDLSWANVNFFNKGNLLFKNIKLIKGKDLIGKKYKPLFDFYSSDENLKNRENGWKIYGGDFVTTEEGTGVVHIAPAFGEDDMELGKKFELPFIQHVGMDGIIEGKAGEFSGLSVKPADDTQKTDVEIIKNLAHRGLLFAKEKFEHSYPHCWRCDTPLLNYATSSWFVAVTKIKNEMLKNAKDINWTPTHIKEGRWGNWLEGARDWSISRQRFWASVMPVWKCDKCGSVEVFGSVADLEKKSGDKIEDIHKDVVDKVTFGCEKCDGTMKRIPDVLDTWFDSGSMPYAQAHYPFENKEKFESSFPAEFIAEGIDQTRAWFYYLHTIASGIKKSRAFNNVIVNGIVLAEDGKKMSKKLKNYPDPMDIFNKYGADAMRYYLSASPVMMAENLNFKENDIADLVRGMFRMLWNSYSFFVLYANIDNFSPEKNYRPSSSNLLDKWIISELHTLIEKVDTAMGEYNLPKAVRNFQGFVDNLSNWYIRRSRKRFWKSENDDDKNQAYATLHYVLVELSKTMAPFTPFIAEEIYRNLTSCHPERRSNGDWTEVEGSAQKHNRKCDIEDSSTPLRSTQNDNDTSVHLQDFPVADESLIDEKLNNDMKTTREIITEALQLRAKSSIKVRQPLAELRIKVKEGEVGLADEFLEIIREEVNVKRVPRDFTLKCETGHYGINLNTEITPELKLEGQAREIVRYIQEMRKEAGYEVDNRIQVCYNPALEVMEKFGDLIAKEVLADKLETGEREDADLRKEFNLEGEKFSILIKK